MQFLLTQDGFNQDDEKINKRFRQKFFNFLKQEKFPIVQGEIWEKAFLQF